jgi:Ca-activated chloride channel family protein
MRYPNGNAVVRVADFPVDKEILQRISKSTDAQFFEAQDKEGLAMIYDEIDRLEKSEVELSVNAIFEELFPWPLTFGLVFLLLEIILSRTIFLRVP